MRLTTEGGGELIDPSESELEDALTKFGHPGNGFAILSTSEQNYIQAQGNRADGYILEYRNGSEEEHFSSKKIDISHERMIATFRAYRGDGNWKTLIEWSSGFPVRSGAGRTKAQDRRRLNAMFALFFATGIVLTAFGIYLAWGTQQFLERVVEVPGTVVKMISAGGWSPVVNYVDQKGQPHTLYSSLRSTPPAFHIGEKVVVVYDPSDVHFPQKAKIRTFGELWFDALLVSGLGGGFVGLSGAAFFSLWRRGRTRGSARRAG